MPPRRTDLQGGERTTDLWLGCPEDPEGGRPDDLLRTCTFIAATCLFFAGATALTLWALSP